MANNELSGPVVLNALIKYIKTNYKKTKYTYRFVLLPETIGSIAYLSRYKSILKKKVMMGFNLSCLGDDKAYSIIKGPNKDDLSYKALYSILRNKKKLKVYDFRHRGSDERQYCSPGIDLPVVGFCRSKYGEYKEYHTDRDNLKLISQKSLEQSLEVLKNLVDVCEVSLFPKTQTFCEPNLSKRNLYPTTSTLFSMTTDLKLRKDILAFSNGKRSIFDLSEILDNDVLKICSEIKILKKNKLII